MNKLFILQYLRLAVFISFTTYAQTTTTSLNANLRDISEVYFGFNRRSDVGVWWTDNSFINRVADINPDIIRYPGGTQANYWDWRTGQFIPNTNKIWGQKQVVTIPTFINVVPDNTKIVYVVNMARPTPATGISINDSEAILKSDATLNLMIADMIDAIDTFVAEGKTPYAIELGNEFFFGNIESGMHEIIQNNGKFYAGWDNTNNAPYESNSLKIATEINAFFYLKRAKKVVAQIKAVYPNMKFALMLSRLGIGDTIRERWNNTILNNLNNNPEFSTLKNDIHALTQHHYLNTAYGLQTPISDAASSKIAIAEGIQYPIDKKADYDIVPHNYKIWYTEFGEVKGIANESWADAVRYAALNYSWLSLGDKVGQLDYHHLTDNSVIKPESTMRLGPVGVAAKQLMLASSGMANMQTIAFNPNPISVNGILSLYGYKFKNTEKETLFILNLNNIDIENITFNNLLSYTGEPTLTQYHSETPWTSGVALGDANILFNNKVVTSNFNAPKFSITVIQAQNESLGDNEFIQQPVSVFPNPVKNKLTIQSLQPIKQATIFNLNGGVVIKIKRIVLNTIDLGSLAPGIYILKTETENTLSTFRKIVKY